MTINEFEDSFENSAFPFTDAAGLVLSDSYTIPANLIKNCNIFSYHPGPIFLDTINVQLTYITLNFSNLASTNILTATMPCNSSTTVATVYDDVGRVSGIISYTPVAVDKLATWPVKTYTLNKEALSITPSCFKTLLVDHVSSFYDANNNKASGHVNIIGGNNVILQQNTNEDSTVVTINDVSDEINSAYYPSANIQNSNISLYAQPPLVKTIIITDVNNTYELRLAPVNDIDNTAGRIFINGAWTTTGDRLQINSGGNSLKFDITTK